MTSSHGDVKGLDSDFFLLIQNASGLNGGN